MNIIEYDEIKILKQSEKSTVLLVRETDGEKVFVQKILKGQHPIYLKLQSCAHPCLPILREVIMADDTTTIIEEYVEGLSLGSAELSEKQILSAVKELCCVLEFLHRKDIIHRDIKPSNIIFAKDGHIRLIDFDAARMPKEDLEQDTRLLGTRGYAPPEQYGFTQTDARADIYSLGVTLKQLLGDNALKPHYRRIIRKCTNLNPDKRYQSSRQVNRALSSRKRSILYAVTGMILIAFLWYLIPPYQTMQLEENQPVSAALIALPAPENPHWNGDTGIALWGNVPDSGVGGQVSYHWRLYRQDTKTPPESNKSIWVSEGGMSGNGGRNNSFPTYETSLGAEFLENGFYYFEVSADGDGVYFSDSPYVISDAFEYTGEFAAPLPVPKGLAWEIVESDRGLQYYAAWSNLDDYADTDSFNVRVYNQADVMVMNNIMTKEKIRSIGRNGIWLSPDFLTKESGPYRFTVQAQTSRPNEYQSSPMPNPVPEEYFSPWYFGKY